MKKAKSQIELIEKRYIAIGILKNGQGLQIDRIRKAQKVSGLSAEEILELNRKYTQKNTKDYDKELNKEGI